MSSPEQAGALPALGARERVVPPLLLAAGLVAAAGSLALDYVGLSDPRIFGVGQLLLAGAGVALGLNALALRAPGGWGRVDAFLAAGRPAQLEAAARYLAVLAQLALLLVVLTRFQIENPAFFETVAVLAFGGFAIHHFVPPAYRLSFFLGLSLAGIGVVFGLRDGAWLVGAGGLLILLCHLPLPWAARVALVAAAGAGLALGRARVVDAPWSDAVWPILGSMFMFRMAVYLYDLRHARTPPSPAQSLSYFFLLPNVVFPLFPVVDFSTYRRTYYDGDAFAIYEKGVRWMFRGVVQLIIYRLIYQYATLPMNEVHTPLDLGRYLVANFGLYIRVSGQFHLITGLLHLFGFNLPLTHNRYFLSSGITDFWRRINIYWKDFMLKLVFNPTYFRLRRIRGETTALVVGTLLVFFVTWALHSYQWFWLLGDFPVTGPDTLFWGTLGVLMVFSTLRETRKGRQRRLAGRAWTLRAAAPLALRTAGTFALITLLWSLWTSPSLKDWLDLITLR